MTLPSANLRPRHTHPSEAGYTLTELLAVLVILVLVIGLVAPQVIGYLSRAKSQTAQVQIENLASALDFYAFDTGSYPPEPVGLKGLVENPEGVSGWAGPYLRKSEVPDDPWGRAYVYRVPGPKGPFDLYTLGADGTEGGDGEDADIHF